MQNALRKLFSNYILFYIISGLGIVASVVISICFLNPQWELYSVVFGMIYIYACIFLTALVFSYKVRNKNLLLSLMPINLVLFLLQITTIIFEEDVSPLTAVFGCLSFVIIIALILNHFVLCCSSKPYKNAVTLNQVLGLCYIASKIAFVFTCPINFGSAISIVFIVADILFIICLGFNVVFVETRIDSFREKREKKEDKNL